MPTSPRETKLPQPRNVKPGEVGYPALLQTATIDNQAFLDSPFLREKKPLGSGKPDLSIIGQPNETPTTYLAVIGSRPPSAKDAQELGVPLATLVQEYDRRVIAIHTMLDQLLQVFGEQESTHEQPSPFALSLISGLTEGGDAEAMKWALANQVPVVGVLASPLDRIHPQGSQAVYNEMVVRIMTGTPGYRLVSRHPWPAGKEWTAFSSLKRDYQPDYIARDRVMAGLSYVTLAWNLRKVMSGAGYTMAVSHGLGRPVFAVQDTLNQEVIDTLRVHPNHVTLITEPEPVVSALIPQDRPRF